MPCEITDVRPFSRGRGRRAALWALAPWALAIWAPALAGCSKPATIESFRPEPATAQAALEAALAHWQQGGKIERISANSLEVDAIDFEWSAGKKLTAYQIGEEGEGTQAAREFKVKLTIGGVAKEVSYFVIGKGPFNVFRDKNFEDLKGG